MVPAVLVAAAGCDCGDGGSGADPDAAADARPDARPTTCQPLPAMGQLTRRDGNPRLVAGAAFPGGMIDTAIFDPDVHYDAAAQRYVAYYMAPHAPAFGAPEIQQIRRATSADKFAWTVDDEPVLAASSDAGAWDRRDTRMPSVAINPDAAPDRRYLMVYAGAAGASPFPGAVRPSFAIGAAFSADGVAFARVPAAESPHGEAGLVLTGAQVYPAAVDAAVFDPEVVYVGGVYHLFFSSHACDGAQCANTTELGVAHATSADGVTWTVEAAPVPSLLRAVADRRSGGQQPSVVYDATHCRWELWLTNDVGTESHAQPVELENSMGVYAAESSDGKTWSVAYASPRALPWTAGVAGERLGRQGGADVAQHSTGRLMLYVGYDDQNIPAGATLPDRSANGSRPGVTTLNIATRDLP